VLEILENCIVLEKTGLYTETQEMFDELQASIGVLQFIRSGRVAVTRSNIERLSDMLANIDKIKLGLND
jgi:acetolactate synthase-1/3 small subunit